MCFPSHLLASYIEMLIQNVVIFVGSQVTKLSTLLRVVSVIRMLVSVFTSASGGRSCRILMLDWKEADQLVAWPESGSGTAPE